MGARTHHVQTLSPILDPKEPVLDGQIAHECQFAYVCSEGGYRDAFANAHSSVQRLPSYSLVEVARWCVGRRHRVLQHPARHMADRRHERHGFLCVRACRQATCRVELVSGLRKRWHRCKQVVRCDACILGRQTTHGALLLVPSTLCPTRRPRRGHESAVATYQNDPSSRSSSPPMPSQPHVLRADRTCRRKAHS